MLKLIFWSLLAANLALFAYGRGYLGSAGAGEHEPARLKAQLAADRMKLVDATYAEAQAARAREAEVAQRASLEVVACTQIGNFDAEAGRRFEARLAELGLSSAATRIDVPEMDVTQYMVHLPPQGSREAAERRAAELKARGVGNYYIIPDSPLRWGVSLGVFKSEQAAQSLRASLARQGVRGAVITGRGPTVTRQAFQLRGVASGDMARVQEARASFPGVASRNCG